MDVTLHLAIANRIYRNLAITNMPSASVIHSFCTTKCSDSPRFVLFSTGQTMRSDSVCMWLPEVSLSRNRPAASGPGEYLCGAHDVTLGLTVPGLASSDKISSFIQIPGAPSPLP